MSKSSAAGLSAIIAAVKNPLGFLVLGLLLLDGTLGALAVGHETYQSILPWIIIISVPTFAVIVVTLAVWKPGVLYGDRPLQKVHANTFASDLFLALDGALSNLKTIEREEAWITVADVITSSTSADESYSKFCSAVAEKLKILAKLTNRTLKTRGPIEV